MKQYRKKSPVLQAITFAELIQYGRDNGANIENGMPWSFMYKGLPVTHERDDLYLVQINNGYGTFLQFTPSLVLITEDNNEPLLMPETKFKALYEQFDAPVKDLSEVMELDGLIDMYIHLSDDSNKLNYVTIQKHFYRVVEAFGFKKHSAHHTTIRAWCERK